MLEKKRKKKGPHSDYCYLLENKKTTVIYMRHLESTTSICGKFLSTKNFEKRQKTEINIYNVTVYQEFDNHNKPTPPPSYKASKIEQKSFLVSSKICPILFFF